MTDLTNVTNEELINELSKRHNFPLGHTVDVTEDGEWTIEHPLSCRIEYASLFGCPVHLTMVREEMYLRPGRYFID